MNKLEIYQKWKFNYSVLEEEFIITLTIKI